MKSYGILVFFVKNCYLLSTLTDISVWDKVKEKRCNPFNEMQVGDIFMISLKSIHEIFYLLFSDK